MGRWMVGLFDWCMVVVSESWWWCAVLCAKAPGCTTVTGRKKQRYIERVGDAPWMFVCIITQFNLCCICEMFGNGVLDKCVILMDIVKCSVVWCSVMLWCGMKCILCVCVVMLNWWMWVCVLVLFCLVCFRYCCDSDESDLSVYMLICRLLLRNHWCWCHMVCVCVYEK